MSTPVPQSVHVDDHETDIRKLSAAELNAAKRETAQAVHQIIDEAETVLALNKNHGDSYRATVEAAMMKILEACSFEDLTGQRLDKVISSLREQQADLTAPAAANDEQGLLEGPAIDAPHMSQAEINGVFAE